MGPSRSEPMYKSNEGMPIDVRPHTALRVGGSTDSPIIHGGRAPISSAPPATPWRIRPPPRQQKALPGTYRKHTISRLPGIAKKGHPPPRSTTRVGSSRVGSSYHKEGAVTLLRDPEYASDYSAAVRDECGVCGDAALDPGDVPFVATWPDEESADGLMNNGLLWRESGFGREMELTTERVRQGVAEACQPVREYTYIARHSVVGVVVVVVDRCCCCCADWQSGLAVQ